MGLGRARSATVLGTPCLDLVLHGAWSQEASTFNISLVPPSAEKPTVAEPSQTTRSLTPMSPFKVCKMPWAALELLPTGLCQVL